MALARWGRRWSGSAFAAGLLACGGSGSVAGTGSPDAGGSTSSGTSTADTSASSTSTTTGDSAGESDTSGDECGRMPLETQQSPCTSVAGPTCNPGTTGVCPDGDKCTFVECAACGVPTDTVDACVPVMGTDPPGGACQTLPNESIVQGLDTCAEGSLCFFADASGAGTCIPFCDWQGAWSCSAPGERCVVLWDALVPICLPDGCDPLVQDCDGGRSCQVLGDAFVCVPPIDPPGLLGSECTNAASCGPGLTCVTGLAECGGAACCTAFCDLSTTTPCAGIPGTECLAYFAPGDAPVGYEHIGVCVTP